MHCIVAKMLLERLFVHFVMALVAVNICQMDIANIGGTLSGFVFDPKKAVLTGFLINPKSDCICLVALSIKYCAVMS